ncbi:MAG: hypothetical protein IBX61_02430 [Thermoleophilia bacterium]|nr:hypothetical protein [Thermoleophilia bacterium]
MPRGLKKAGVGRHKNGCRSLKRLLGQFFSDNAGFDNLVPPIFFRVLPFVFRAAIKYSYAEKNQGLPEPDAKLKKILPENVHENAEQGFFSDLPWEIFKGDD